MTQSPKARDLSRRLFHLRRQLIRGELKPGSYFRLLRCVLAEHTPTAKEAKESR